jgi:type IV secretory pathway protease TraF
MKRFIALAAVVCAIAGGWLARPARWEVEGLSMAPGLMPGDVAATDAFPIVDRWRRPRRFERWTLAAPDGALAIKRVWGLPGEEFEIVAGDLVIAGEAVVKPPRVLAEVALPVAATSRHETDGAVRLMLSDPVFDDVPFAPGERRVLVPVRDVGMAAVIDVGGAVRAATWVSIEARVADCTVRITLCRPGRHAVVVGRLDGAFVAAAWPAPTPIGHRACLPSGGPARWMLERPWRGSGAVTELEVRVGASASPTGGVTIEDVVAWRDIHHLPPASGTIQWSLVSADVFVLGDAPGASCDSRHWGSVELGRLQHRLAPGAR